jgi:hypothetical protein
VTESTWFLAAFSGLFAIAFGLGFAKAPPNSIAALKARYRSLTRLARRQADADLQHRIVALAERFPGKSERWYLEWLVKDLERAKR